MSPVLQRHSFRIRHGAIMPRAQMETRRPTNASLSIWFRHDAIDQNTRLHDSWCRNGGGSLGNYSCQLPETMEETSFQTAGIAWDFLNASATLHPRKASYGLIVFCRTGVPCSPTPGCVGILIVTPCRDRRARLLDACGGNSSD